MNREEAIEMWVIPALKNTWNEKRCNEILEALEQEPILDKISAEIEEQKKERCFDDDDMFAYRTGLDDALYIIDKYKAEGSEE